MNKIEVDPRLFITCRLCLEDLGIYQIDPAVKEQISYCFDIRVEPFDGLPQLICKKCEAILNNYSLIKKTIVGKQNDLKKKIQGSHNSQVKPDIISSSKLIEFESTNQNVCKFKTKDDCISSSDSENDKDCNENKSEEMPALLSNYTKHYVCRICSSRWLDIKSLKSHINLIHFTFKKKYSHIFKKHCKVKLHSVDEKLNVIGSRSKVMHSREKIIQNVSSDYYILYTTKDNKENDCQENDTHGLNMRGTVKNYYFESSDSSDGQIIVRRKRVRRICSRSSNETVVLDSANKSNFSDNEKESHNAQSVQSPKGADECINIDDSSDSDPENGKTQKEIENEKTGTGNKKLKQDQSTINGLITSTQSKFIKKNYHNNLIIKSNKSNSEIAIQLKRKILSIGRKIINKKKPIHILPLLRFLEHKNLDVAWISRTIAHGNQDSIRILTRLKNASDNAICCETGWTETPKPSKEQTYYNNVLKSSQRHNFVASLIQCNNASNDNDISEVSSVSSEKADNAVPVNDANSAGNDTKKLLNKNPVANPKQLPKKPVKDIKNVKVVASKEAVSNIEITPQENNEIDYTMPIITSTTSLAMPTSRNDGCDFVHTLKVDDQKTGGPRIKVKPVSELMSAESLNRMQEPKQITALLTYPMTLRDDSNVIKGFGPQLTTVLSQIITTQPSVGVNAEDPVWNNEYMILNTTELPNTRTNSPFQYFRRLLELHTIILLDTDVQLTTDFVCLVKFKVMYNQQVTNQPVILCLSLYCTKNVFCMKIKDRNQDDINLSKISANWQWEVLKIYKGEVVSKLMYNAQKIGQEVFEFTNKFMCLLKSITLVNV